MTLQAATILAQKKGTCANVRQTERKRWEFFSSLPVITPEEGLQLYFEIENIHAFHLQNPHTDRDALVFL